MGPSPNQRPNESKCARWCAQGPSWTEALLAGVIGSVSGKPGDAKNDLLELDDPALPDGAVSGRVPSPTLIPAFDPSQYAEESEIRERMPTLTDEPLLEQARLQSFPTNAPPPRRQRSTMPPAPFPGPRDSSVEIDVGEDDLDALGPDEQIAILRARLAPLSRVPILAHQLSDIGSALEDPKTAYVIGFVDGILPLDTIIDVTGLPELDTLRVLDRMIGLGVVSIRGRHPRF